MKAVCLKEQGGYDKFIYGGLPEPVIEPDEVLVRIRAVGVNRRDAFEREGSHGVRITGNHIPGLDLAGESEDVGSNVAYTQPFKRGNRVLGVSFSGGTFAEYSRAHVDRIALMPDWMSFEEAAAIPTVYTTTWGRARHLARHLDDVLIAEITRRPVGLGGPFGVEHHLDKAPAVPQVDEDQAAVVPPPVHPPR